MSSPTIPPTCPYCGQQSEKVSGDMIYKGRPDLASKWFYRCQPCDARVGCHPKSDRPLGTLANAALRRLRSEAHALFDPLWKEHKLFPNRGDAYSWLQMRLGRSEAVHIGESDEETCGAIITVCQEVVNKLAEERDTTIVANWMAEVLEELGELPQHEAQAAASRAEAQQAKYRTDARWGSW